MCDQWTNVLSWLPPSISLGMLRDAAHGLTVCLTPPYNNLDNLAKGARGRYD